MATHSKHFPPLTERQRRHLDAMKALPDDQVNLADIPELTDEQLADMKHAAHYRPVKKQITIRVDADVLAWLKSHGKGYQSRINAILRRRDAGASPVTAGNAKPRKGAPEA